MEPVSESFTVGGPAAGDGFSLDLRRLAVLRELRRRGSLAATAQALHLTPSAVSQQIAALSRETGAPLTERAGRGVRLTGQARILLDHADRIAAQLERARSDLAAYESGARGTVTLGAFSSAIVGLLPDALRTLADRLPEVEIRVREAQPPDVFTALDAGRIDVVVAVDFTATPPHTDRRYTRTDLLTDVLDLALPPGHRLAPHARVNLRDLATERWIVGDAANCCGAVTRAVCAAAGFSPDIRHEVDDWSAVAALVAAGAGVALIPRLVQHAYAPHEVTLHAATPTPSRNVFAAVRAGAEHNPVVGAVVEALRNRPSPEDRCSPGEGQGHLGGFPHAVASPRRE
ncbi:LysR family transcriptional regulator [Streptomyces sp. NPDC001904]|uniref:LysR family transcriptional regulator n=1 Tax=Streptomyces sp. NPDC001904 TaxID=3154531 RepID=UPI00332E69A1